MLRLFVGIGFPPELKLRLSLLCSGISGAKWVDPAISISTLRFIRGKSARTSRRSRPRIVRLRARRFALQLAGTGVFGGGGDKPRSLWVGVERGPELLRPARQDRAGADPRRAAAGAAQIRPARHLGAAE